MRLFIGYYPPDTVVDYIYSIEEKLKSKNIKANYSARQNLHITFRFLGEVEECRVNDIKNVLNNYKNLNINLDLNKVGFFNKSQNSTIWVGLNGELKKLEDSVYKLNDDLSIIGFEKESRRFKPHITIARKFNVLDNYNLEALNNISIENTEFNIGEINLIKSTLTPNGPIYDIIY
jgi:RNA 2',3'-cyclic 3'-phosphodiesterase